MNSGLTGALGTAPLQTVKIRLGSFQGQSHLQIPFPRNGSLVLGQSPSSSSTSGIKRGAFSIDLQTNRTSSNQTTPRAYQIAIGNENALVNSAVSNFTLAGSTAIGSSNTIGSGFNGIAGVVALGALNTSSGQGCVAIGLGNSATQGHSIALGGAGLSGSLATAQGAIALNGISNQRNMISFGVDNWSVFRGWEFQKNIYRAGIKTSNNTPVLLTLSADGTSKISITSGTILTAIIQIVGIKSNGASVARFTRQATIKNIAGTTSLVGSVETIGTDYQDDLNTNVTLLADDANDALNIEVVQGQASFAATGVASTDIITAVGHNFADGQNVVFISLTGGSGLNTTTNYYVRDVAGDTFKLSTSIGGGAVNFTTDITDATIGEVWRWCAIVEGMQFSHGT